VSAPLTFSALFPFCGLGAGARGFLDAQVELFGRRASFRSLGGIDIDPEGCADFERLTGSPALCADVTQLAPADVRAFAGKAAPDVVFMSPPCKGASRLLSAAKSKLPKYQALNRLALVWTRLMLASWDERPKLVLLENVPGIRSRAADVLAEVRRLLEASGYAIHEQTHDCGELGGLGQRRERFLLVARHARSLPPFLYQPPKRRVRGVGEVIGELPLPGAPEAGPLHRLPKLAPLTWERLRLIPAGGDWRDLEDVLAEGQKRREVFERYRVTPWNQPASTVAGSGTNGTYAVADPRVKTAYDAGYGVLAWKQPARTIAGKSHSGCGAYAVADPRLGCAPRAGAYGVLAWNEPAKTVTGAAGIDNGSFAVADPRPEPQLVVDGVPVILSDDGTWHRPLTLRDMASLQGLPLLVGGEPLTLAGKSLGRWRERIGNAVPVGTAEAIARQMLVTLAHGATGEFFLSGEPIWVSPEQSAEVAP
jgi:site-specific DNA-cytosine methylase